MVREALDGLPESTVRTVEDELRRSAATTRQLLEASTLWGHGLERPRAMAVLARLEAGGLVEVYRRFFHDSDECDRERWFAERRFRDGPPPLPLSCPICGGDIEWHDDVDLEIFARVTGALDPA